MKSMVVLFALCAMACGSLVAQPPHLPALVLDPHGRPLDTAEVINSRALHLQAKALEGHYGHGALVAPYAHSVALAPTYGYNTPLLAHSGLGYAGHGHYLYKRSLGHYAAPSAVSHQSRLDVISSPTVVSHAITAPVVAHATPFVAAAPAAVSHQSRVDVHTSPAVVTHAAVAPLAHAAVVPLGHHGALAHINHAAVAPIGYATPYSYGHGYYNSAPSVHAW